jgi:ATP-dependent helicase/nuclease subunit A
MSKMPGFGAYVKYLHFLSNTADEWRSLLEVRGYDALAGVARGWQAPNLPPMATGMAGKEVAKGMMDRLKEQFTKGPAAAALRFTSGEWREGLRLALPHARVFVELVRLFAARYRKEKKALGALDFSDLERHTLDLLREPKAKGLVPSGVARQLRKRYRYVLVDEYQDINEVQDAILALLSRQTRGGGGGDGNLFCVGDVKQSIYGFRLAEPARFIWDACSTCRRTSAAGGRCWGC